MKNKKTVYILLSVVAVLLVGFALSSLIDWPVDLKKSEGNVSKSSRFSRKTAADGLSNMHELLLNDEDFKNTVVLSYVVMDTRSAQFNALVDMSAEVAGDIPEFKSVIKDMQKAKKTAENVCASMKAAGEDLDAALGGEKPDNLAQNTTNAALAYNTLQKQNNLANRFIETTDKYLENNEADDRLKLVRDQWAEYQQVTATLENDVEAANALKEKGYLLDAEQTTSALNLFDNMNQLILIRNSALSDALNCNSSFNVLEAINKEQLSMLANQQELVVLQGRPRINPNSEVIDNQSLANQQALANQQEAVLQGRPKINPNSEVIDNNILNSFDIVSSLGSFSELTNLSNTTYELSLKSWSGADNVIGALPISDAINALAAGDATALQAIILM
ncbi:MAG: hypothetical protein J6P56_01870 [Bacteroidales bacterium]|nr:hypothetical protein [Bacteroidales bacterium]